MPVRPNDSQAPPAQIFFVAVSERLIGDREAPITVKFFCRGRIRAPLGPEGTRKPPIHFGAFFAGPTADGLRCSSEHPNTE